MLRAERASMDERLSLLGLIFDSVSAQLRMVCERENILDLVTGQLKTLKEKLKDVSGAAALLSEMIEAEREKLERGKQSSSISPQTQRETRFMLEYLEEFRAAVMQSGTAQKDEFSIVRESFAQKVAELKGLQPTAAERLKTCFRSAKKPLPTATRY